MVEDYLDPIGLSLEDLRDGITGGWTFGYVDALMRAGVETDLIYVSRAAKRIECWRHAATGAPLFLLPQLRSYRALRRLLKDPYAWSHREAIGDSRGVFRTLGMVARHVAPYRATPAVALARLARARGHAALVCQEYEYARFDVCAALGTVLKVPTFATFQGGDYQLTRWERKVRPLTLRACNGIIVGSTTEAQRVRARYGMPEDKIASIFNPFDVEAWHPGDGSNARQELGIPPEVVVFAWHGRVEMHRKGLDVLCHAWHELCTRHANLQPHLLLVGTGADAHELRRRIHDMSLRRVHWVDDYVVDRSRVRRYLAAADVYVFPSRREGFPVAPIEAMATGLPLVAAEAPGVADILPQGLRSGGIIVPQADGPALANGMARLIEDEELRRELGRRARSRAETAFSPTAVGRALRDFMTEHGARASRNGAST